MKGANLGLSPHPSGSATASVPYGATVQWLERFALYFGATGNHQHIDQLVLHFNLLGKHI
jgi:hypothetical protein